MMMKRSQILLVNTPLKSAGAPGRLYPSLANLTLGSYLARKGCEVALLDPTVDLDSPDGPAPSDPMKVLENSAKKVVQSEPEVLGITTMGHTEGSFAIALARAVRSRAPNLPIVLGGSWATGYAPLILERYPFVDGIALGAGEHATSAALDAGIGRCDRADIGRLLTEIPGWASRDRHGGFLKTNAGPRLSTEDSPPLDLTLLGRPEMYDTMVYLTSRGCPFGCAFCTEPFMFDGQLHEAIDKVAVDLRAFDEVLGADYLWLCDPLFGASRQRLDVLLPHLEASNLSFLYESRVDTLDPAEIPRIRSAGGDLVYLGLEAASESTLLRMNKVPSAKSAHRYLARAREVIEACAESDVVPVVGVLNPIPGDRAADLDETLRFLGELNELAEAGAKRAGTDIRPFFYAFPYRVDLGTEAARNLAGEARPAGCSTNVREDELFVEREVLQASPTVDPAAAAAFREAVRESNRGGNAVMGRVFRSMPRPFLAQSWMVDDAG